MGTAKSYRKSKECRDKSRWYHFGTIMRSGPGTYDFEVQGDNGRIIVCVWLAGILSHSVYGYRESILPIEGTTVMYMELGEFTGLGLIFGCVPQIQAGEYDPKRVRPAMSSVSMGGGASAFTEKGGMDVTKDKKKASVLTAVSDRLRDIFPGEYALSNEQGIVFALRKIMATLKASERSKIEFFVIDDLVRITSGMYQHMTAFGPFQIYNDNGKISAELMASAKQQEFYGDLNTAEHKSAVQEQSYDKKKDKEGGWKLTPDKRAPFSRFQFFLGELGAFVHTILCSPQEGLTIEKDDVVGKHTGLFQQVISDSGKLMVKAADGITFVRCDAIPVPKKMFEAWDPGGDREAPTDTKKEPFKYDSENPWSRSLLLRDYVAYFEKMTYMPFDKRKKDWKVPEAKELDVPQDEYDKVDNRKADFKANADAQSVISMEDDGSIILRDSWGSEIYMRGGNIIISCPGEIQLKSGMSTVVLAGNDFIAKANDSIDIVATNKDVRVKGQKNVHMCAMDQSILVESRGMGATSNPTNYEKKPSSRGSILEGHKTDSDKPKVTLDYNSPGKGEDSAYCGVVLHAPSSQVHISSPIIELASSYRVIIRAIKDKTVDLYVRCKTFFSTCTNSFAAVCNTETSTKGKKNEGSGITMTPENLILVGSQATLSASKNTVILSQAGSQYAAFNPTRGTNDSGTYSAIHNDAVKYTVAPSGTVASAAVEKEDKIKFTFRTLLQYGTETVSSIKNIGSYEGRMKGNKADSEFKVYQSPWQFIYSSSPNMKECNKYWIDQSASYAGYDYYTAKQCYYYLPNEVNVIKGGRSKGRENVVNEPAKLVGADMGSYKIIEQ